MNAKLAKMVEDMKKQTIGVEIEMAEITRQLRHAGAVSKRPAENPPKSGLSVVGQV